MTQLQTSLELSQSGGIPSRHYSKFTVALLAAVLGVFGAHWWYLGRRYAWMATAVPCILIALAQFYPSWWDNPAFLLLIIPATAACIEALVFALKPDDKFDAKYNAQSGRTTRTGWGPVIIAILTTMFGGTVLVFGIAVTVMHVYVSMGWLDGFVL